MALTKLSILRWRRKTDNSIDEKWKYTLLEHSELAREELEEKINRDYSWSDCHLGVESNFITDFSNIPKEELAKLARKWNMVI